MPDKFLQATTLDEALAFASHEPNSVFVAGGTDVLVNRMQGNVASTALIDITGIESLKKIEQHGNMLSIGSLVTLSNIIQHKEIQNHFPALVEAANSVATPVIRRTATLGGNILCENRCEYYNQSAWWRKAVGYCLKCDGKICIATKGKENCYSKFVSDTAPVLIAYKAQITLTGKKGEEVVPLETLYSGDGVNPIKKEKDVILKNILLPLNVHFRAVFKKLRPRKSLDFTSVSTAVSIGDTDELRIVIGGADPMPVLIVASRNDDITQLIKMAVQKPRIIKNDYYSRPYRKKMMERFIRVSLDTLNLSEN